MNGSKFETIDILIELYTNLSRLIIRMRVKCKSFTLTDEEREHLEKTINVLKNHMNKL